MFYSGICGRDNTGKSLGITKFPIHGIFAMINEIRRGTKVKQDLINWLNLNAQGQIELDEVIARYQLASDKTMFLQQLQSVMFLAELNLSGYGTPTELQAVISGL